MKLTPVESSHIAAIGYLEDERVLLIKYRTGALYTRIGTTPAEYQSLMDAPSKGGYLASLPKHAGVVLISKGESHGQPLAAAPAESSTPTAGALNVIDEDASPCCRKALAFHEAHGINQQAGLECGECGTNFRPEMVGAVCHWRIVPLFALHRNR